jgi:hypothetical protein
VSKLSLSPAELVEDEVDMMEPDELLYVLVTFP